MGTLRNRKLTKATRSRYNNSCYRPLCNCVDCKALDEVIQEKYKHLKESSLAEYPEDFHFKDNCKNVLQQELLHPTLDEVAKIMNVPVASLKIRWSDLAGDYIIYHEGYFSGTFEGILEQRPHNAESLWNWLDYKYLKEKQSGKT